MRTKRKNTVLAVTAAAVLSLGLSACGGGDDAATRDEGAAAAQSQNQAGGGTGGATTTGGSTKGASSTGGTSGGSTAGGSTGGSTAGGSTGGSTAGGAKNASSAKSSANAPACTYNDVKITTAKADETPTEHIVLTATNTSGKTCRLYGYPLIAFGPIQTAKDVPAVAKSKPAAPVVLQPGAPAYANVRIALGGAHEDNKVVNSFNVNLFTGSDPAEGSVVVKAPAGGLAVDEAAAKTGYWTYELRNGADEF
ncbi:DUF4232 domain-containing protein [Streptomyces showdoensis]|uniref:DUF4232 domain-containing protein n=1 Tax=Streptomyces showdoensis TaxID=68268 RepID=A0A2P2GF83_STREW|nr:DUF4232 domain-containing protein [Streptomyces showdoensis]KKZ70174.1 hypothetical protein VO63_30340 [Streptomyces showdoensis]